MPLRFPKRDEATTKFFEKVVPVTLALLAYLESEGILRPSPRLARAVARWDGRIMQKAAEEERIANAPPVTSQTKVGRNDPCPCGSGKKWKHCCGRPGRGARTSA